MSFWRRLLNSPRSTNRSRVAALPDPCLAQFYDAQMGDVVELDEPNTWPATVHELAQLHRRRHPDDFTSAHENDLREALNGSPMRFFHCTRITHLELGRIRTSGLKRMTRLLAKQRLEDLESNELTISERSELLARSETCNTARDVCLFAPKDLLGDTGTLNLLSHWGGEALYGEYPQLRPKLQRIGIRSLLYRHALIGRLGSPNCTGYEQLTGHHAALAELLGR